MAREQPLGLQSILIVLAFVGALAAPHLKAEDASSGKEHSASTAAPVQSASVGIDAKANPPKPEPDPYERFSKTVLTELHELMPGIEIEPSDLSNVAAEAKAENYRLSPFVVCIPDPKQSHMALYYDQSLVALRQAAARLGYVQSRFNLPWQSDVHGGQGPSSGKTEAAQADDRSAKIYAPGLMIFSPTAKPNTDGKQSAERTLLVTILVTESPILGIQSQQLADALKAASALSDSRRVAVLGPFFSGGAASLEAGLAHAPVGSNISVMTGTATGENVDSQLANRAMRRVVPVDSQLAKLAVGELRSTDECVRIARLSELGTAYGQSAETADPTACKDRALQSFEFPIHISEVRAELEATQARQADLFPSLRRTLGLKLNPGEEREPDIPTMLSSLSPYDDDLTLGQTLSQICEQRFKYVLVQATDPVDVVFIAQQMRKFCRDVVLVTLGYDELFIHPDLGSATSGMLVASTYAPSYAISSFVYGHSEHPFPNSVTQGFFNAFLSLARGDAVDPRGAAPVGQFCTGSSDCQPELYLSQIAAGRFWPLKIAPSPPTAASAETCVKSGSDGDFAKETSSSSPSLPSNSARLFAWLAIFGATAHCCWQYLERGIFRRADVRLQPVRRCRLIVADTSLAVVVGLTALPLAALLQMGQAFRSTVGYMVAFDGLLLLALSCLALSTWRRSEIPAPAGTVDTKGEPQPAEVPSPFDVYASMICVAIAVAAVAATCLACHGALITLVVGTPSLDVQLRWLRFLEPFGASPLMPFVYLSLGIYLWSLFALVRIARLTRFPRHLTKAFATLADVPRHTLDAVCTELQVPWSKTRYWTVMVVVFGFCCWRFARRLDRSLEGWTYDVGFLVCFFALALLLAGEVVRFITLSGCLLEFLRDLAAEPMIDAYDRIAGKFSGSFGLQFSARVPEPHEFQISVLAAKTLANLSDLQELKAATKDVEDKMNTLNESSPHVYRAQTRESISLDLAKLQCAVHEAFFTVAGILHTLLATRWKERAEKPDLKRALEAVNPKELLPLGEHGRSPTAVVLMGAMEPESYIWSRTAEDFVAMRTSTFIYQVLHELRHTLVFALIASSLLATSTTCFPFQPARFLSLCVWSVVLIIIAIGLWRMVALERNEVLSRLGGTKADSIEWNAAFVQQIALYVLLPLAAALVGLFPEIGDAIAAHLAPIARLLPSAT